MMRSGKERVSSSAVSNSPVSDPEPERPPSIVNLPSPFVSLPLSNPLRKYRA